ncbi:MAG: transcriptional regulator [Deltaproteobacteria bacterium CG11_big_fil_rev_8_21_14_0_20_49_13]|nr:MAG: transcriptional regulator [Deltaproteobacteria bacterium CG11_big_fil_rev_8_21_14_0_20_49_13]
MKKKTNFDLSRMCKAFGHPIRMQIVKHLKGANKCVCGKIVDILPIAQATVSQHIKVLKEAGIISGKISGPSTCYCIDKGALKEFKRMVREL